MNNLREKDLAEKILAEPDSAKAREVVAKLESLEIKDGKVILKSRVRPKSPDGEMTKDEPDPKAAGKKGESPEAKAPDNKAEDDPAARTTPDVKEPGDPSKEPKPSPSPAPPGDGGATKPAPER